MEHTEEEALRGLFAKGCQVATLRMGKRKTAKWIYIPKDHELGNGSWGRVSYLINHRGYGGWQYGVPS